MYYYNTLSDISKDYDLFKIAAETYNNYEVKLGNNQHESIYNILNSFKNFLRENKIELLQANDCNIMCNGIKGYLTIQDIFALYSMALQIPKDGIIYEIGSYMGLSTSIMGSALKATNNLGAKIYCIDLFEIFPLEKFNENMSRVNMTNFITPVKSDSVKAAELFPDKSGDLIFVDASHTYEGCLRDLNAWYSKTKIDGALIGHDYYNNDVDQVQKAVAQFVFEQSLLSNFEKPLFGSVIYYLFPSLKDYRMPLYNKNV